jgi:hypothetical protein
MQSACIYRYPRESGGIEVVVQFQTYVSLQIDIASAWYPIEITMSRIPAHGVPSETKPRGANRSTKVAGKLKVLPEQPEPPGLHRESSKEREESVGTVGDSDDGDVDEAEDEEQEDVEVRVFCLFLIVILLRMRLGL